MKSLKSIPGSLLFLIIALGFYQCASTQKTKDKFSVETGDVYYQHWVSGVKGGGSGYNLFVPIKSNPDNIVLDSLYFKGKRVKLEPKGSSVFVGRFKSNANQKQDIIMSSDSLAEYGNSIPDIPQKTPFKLKDTECIISYQKGNKTLYHKISNITKKTSANYPVAPPKR